MHAFRPRAQNSFRKYMPPPPHTHTEHYTKTKQVLFNEKRKQMIYKERETCVFVQLLLLFVFGGVGGISNTKVCKHTAWTTAPSARCTLKCLGNWTRQSRSLLGQERDKITQDVMQLYPCVLKIINFKQVKINEWRSKQNSLTALAKLHSLWVVGTFCWLVRSLGKGSTIRSHLHFLLL